MEKTWFVFDILDLWLAMGWRTSHSHPRRCLTTLEPVSGVSGGLDMSSNRLDVIVFSIASITPSNLSFSTPSFAVALTLL
ncbi:hypothetical protein KCU76_g63, partial [Aureobasidium melanogenum]